MVSVHVRKCQVILLSVLGLGVALSLPECISPRPWTTAAAIVETCGPSFEKHLNSYSTIIVLTFALTGLLELYMQVLLLSDITKEEKFSYMIDHLKTTLDH